MLVKSHILDLHNFAPFGKLPFAMLKNGCYTRLVTAAFVNDKMCNISTYNITKRYYLNTYLHII